MKERGLPKVLYVDDEQINLDLLRLTFLNEFNIITALSAHEGLEMLEQQPDIHVIISDLRMPVMDGL
ncbi:MAG: response regulator, partial [Bacteroidales bacterium]